MKHSIKPYSKDISEVHEAFYKSTKDYLIPEWCIIKRKIKSTRCSKIYAYHVNKTKTETYRVEERWDTFRGIPNLRRLILLEYLLGVPWASPSMNSCLSSFSSYRDLLNLRTLHPHKT